MFEHAYELLYLYHHIGTNIFLLIVALNSANEIKQSGETRKIDWLGCYLHLKVYDRNQFIYDNHPIVKGDLLDKVQNITSLGKVTMYVKAYRILLISRNCNILFPQKRIFSNHTHFWAFNYLFVHVCYYYNNFVNAHIWLVADKGEKGISSSKVTRSFSR